MNSSLRRSLVAVPLALGLSGCVTTGLSNREGGQAVYPEVVYELVHHAPDAAPGTPLRRPVRLAVAQIGEVAPPASLLAELRRHASLIESVVALPMPGAPRGTSFDGRARNNDTRPGPGSRAPELCALARSLGADHVLVLGGTIDTWSVHNPLALLDVTLVGMAIVPSTHVHAAGKAAGILVAVG